MLCGAAPLFRRASEYRPALDSSAEGRESMTRILLVGDGANNAFLVRQDLETPGVGSRAAPSRSVVLLRICAKALSLTHRPRYFHGWRIRSSRSASDRSRVVCCRLSWAARRKPCGTLQTPLTRLTMVRPISLSIYIELLRPRRQRKSWCRVGFEEIATKAHKALREA